MKIWLCFKEYDVKFSNDAKRRFYESTKRDLLGTIQDVMLCFLENPSEGTLKNQSKARKVLPEIQAAELLHSVIKAANKSIPREEIEDAIARTPWRQSVDDNDKCNPWPLVVYNMGLEYDELLGGAMPEKKLKADILDLLGQS